MDISVSFISVAQGLNSVFMDAKWEEIRSYIHQPDTNAHTHTHTHTHSLKTWFFALRLFSYINKYTHTTCIHLPILASQPLACCQLQPLSWYFTFRLKGYLFVQDRLPPCHKQKKLCVPLFFFFYVLYYAKWREKEGLIRIIDYSKAGSLWHKSK